MPKAPPKREENNFLTIGQVQSYLGIKSRKTILKYIANGKLPAYKIGGTRWRVSMEDVHAFLKKQLVALSNSQEKKDEKIPS